MIKAYPLINDHWRLQPDKWNETFENKGIIKGCGGMWDGQHWQLRTNELQDLVEKLPNKVEIMHYVLCAKYCCMPEMKIWVNDDTIARGAVLMNCGKCKKPPPPGEELFAQAGHTVKIVQILKDVYLLGEEIMTHQPTPKTATRSRRKKAPEERRDEPDPEPCGPPSDIDDDLPF